MLNVAARLDALADYRILDTPPEPEFDDIVKIAQRVCDTPVVLVSLVAEDRQWFKARIGFGPCETPIGQSVCAHAMEVDELLVITDLTQDPRTKDNTLVTEAPFIRFYAGAVLRTPDGIPIGSLCVIDGVPRPAGLTPIQAETLTALARQVMVVMALRKAMADRDAALVEARQTGLSLLGRATSSENAVARMHLDQAHEADAKKAGGIGTFVLDADTYGLRVSAEFCRIFGLAVAPEHAAADVQGLVVEADRRFLATPQTTAEGTVPREIEFRILRANDGAERWIGRTADFRTDDAGVVTAMVGIVRDITDRKLDQIRVDAMIRLGDDLRDATATSQVVDSAARTLGETLDASRCALALVDLAAGTFTVERDWSAPGVDSVAGCHSLDGLRIIVDRLEDGVPVVNANIPADRWLAGDHQGYEALGVKAQIVVPLIERRRLVAALVVHSAVPRTWSRSEIDFAVAVADRTYAALAKIRAEEQQRVLNLELSHRLKNTLAMVQAIANQTLRGVTERNVVKALEDRIIALSKAHEVLLEQNFASAPLAGVVAQVMELHGHDAQIASAGPNVTLGPKATLSLSLLLHELATNAIKYGSLSAETGRVSLEWRIDRTGAEPMFSLNWQERGGPPAQAPTRKGFGSRLIGMGIVGAGNARLDYRLEGLTAEFSAPLRAIDES